MSQSDTLAEHLANQLIPIETEAELIARIEGYLLARHSDYLSDTTRLALCRAAILRWKRDHR